MDPIITTVKDTIKLFLKPDNNGPFCQISTYLFQLSSSGIHTGGNAKTSPLLFREVESIHSNGAIITIAPIHNRIKINVLTKIGRASCRERRKSTTEDKFL